jgi:hypothetical protein
LKKISIEPVAPLAVAPEDVFATLEKSRADGELAPQVTRGVIYYEASHKRPGLLDQINTATGERRSGQFRNGEFQAFAE